MAGIDNLGVMKCSAPYIVKMPELINMIWYQFAIYYQLHRVPNMMVSGTRCRGVGDRVCMGHSPNTSV